MDRQSLEQLLAERKLPESLLHTLPPRLAGVFWRVAQLAEEAGALILRYYSEPAEVSYKDDESPVTTADEAANDLILAGLSRLLPEIPVISEEGGLPPYEERSEWPCYFLVDPLDGTKGFIRRNAQFTVNIAYMENHRPVAGIIHVPLKGSTYLGVTGVGAYRIGDGEVPVQDIRTSRVEEGEAPVVLQSNVDKTPRLDAYMGDAPHTRLRVGSSYKFCLLAEGRAQLFPCLHATWEWDTAAGQALLEAAGGSLCGFEGEPFLYGKPDLLNGWFVARA
ncbi:3'(2'),5'-bisphosphate nucleotidase CysQ [Desulfovibrio mangrovi]|uniref:3'(2'),5'-bisphosphate nucleotidase CysQ n=1 Tax=Desulfovibrio mangrovi TaxID=2976983 RepID=UPI002246E410|nr:3'(2'),5'-bisphosphate nucleotidase CysQ [Desulfovibrio mangrovi]UZP66530.1 3'(2'),5'-bisphosphate nucleotidase CysQ [Desulfovibrio mangrovi]